MSNFTITYQAQTASVAIQVERLNQNWSDIQIGLTSGEKDVSVANATTAGRVTGGHAVVASSVTSAHGFVEQTATVAGLLEGTRYLVTFCGYVSSSSSVIRTPNVMLNGASLVAGPQLSGATSFVSTFTRGSYPVSAGDRLACAYTVAGSVYYLISQRDPSDFVSASEKLFYSIPRSGSVVSISGCQGFAGATVVGSGVVTYRGNLISVEIVSDT
jgi:hypothetical protein